MSEGDDFLNKKTPGKSLFYFQNDWSSRPLLTFGKLKIRKMPTNFQTKFLKKN